MDDDVVATFSLGTLLDLLAELRAVLVEGLCGNLRRGSLELTVQKADVVYLIYQLMVSFRILDRLYSLASATAGGAVILRATDTVGVDAALGLSGTPSPVKSTTCSSSSRRVLGLCVTLRCLAGSFSSGASSACAC